MAIFVHIPHAKARTKTWPRKKRSKSKGGSKKPSPIRSSGSNSTSAGSLPLISREKMRKHYIRIIPGDRVKVEISAYDMTRGRIRFEPAISRLIGQKPWVRAASGPAQTMGRLARRPYCEGFGANRSTGDSQIWNEVGHRPNSHPDIFNSRLVKPLSAVERQITHAPFGHIFTNANVWSRNSRRIVYDVRSDHAGEVFDGDRIETVDVATGEVRVLYRSINGAKCGVATFSPTADRVVFILGPEHPTADFDYGPERRRGVMVDESRPGEAIALDVPTLCLLSQPGLFVAGRTFTFFRPMAAE